MTSGDFTATLARKRMGAGVLLSDQRGGVLLVEPTYKPHWEIPGGSVEAGESPYAAAVVASWCLAVELSAVYLENGYLVA